MRFLVSLAEWQAGRTESQDGTVISILLRGAVSVLLLKKSFLISFTCVRERVEHRFTAPFCPGRRGPRGGRYLELLSDFKLHESESAELEPRNAAWDPPALL